MPIAIPHITITNIPNNRPAAVPSLWNSRFSEISENFRVISGFSAWAECKTGAGDAAKTATCSNLKLSTGVSVFVRFAQTNSAANPTLNINGTGAKPIFFNGKPVPVGRLEKDCVYPLTFDGKNWIVTGGTSVLGTEISPTIQNAIDAGDVYGKGVHAAFLSFNTTNKVS